MKVTFCFHRFQFSMERVEDVVLPAAYYSSNIKQFYRLLVSTSWKQTPFPKNSLCSRLAGKSDHSPPLISLYLITERAHDKNSIGLYLFCVPISEPSTGVAEPAESPLVSGVGVAGIDVIVSLDIIKCLEVKLCGVRLSFAKWQRR